MKRFLASLTALALCLALLPAPARAAGNTYTVSSEAEFTAALSKAAPGDTIVVSGSVLLMENSQNSLVIDKAVTIRGGTLIVRYSGILLGADVTFRDIALQFPSRSRNAIMANGYTLTLQNVARDPSGQQIHLFCGGMTGRSQTVPGGSHGRVVIQGSTSLGNIYAGSISTDGRSNCFDQPASILIDSSATGTMGAVYACGALETYVEDNWMDVYFEVDPPTPRATGEPSFPVTGPVDIQLYRRVTASVNGETGGSRNAAVTFAGNQYPTENVVLENLSALSIAAGSLTPAQGSSFSGTDAALSVSPGAALDLSRFGSTLSVGSLSGGGSLVLAQSQSLAVSGPVSGATTVYIDSAQAGGSGAVPLENHTYIRAPQSAPDSFVLAKYSGRPDLDLRHDPASGNWTATASGGGGKVIVERLGMAAEAAAPSGSAEIEIPLDPVYGSNSASPAYIDFIPLGITVNDRSATRREDNGYYTYTIGYSLILEVMDDALYIRSYSGGAIPDNVYRITLAIPKDYTAAGKLLQGSTTLTVGGEPDVPVSIPIPTANPGLKWTGGQQTGVEEGPGYTLTGHKATAVGSYTATALLLPGHLWADGSDSPKSIPWAIEKADGPAAPTGLTGAAPTSANGSDGRITGTTALMEYAAHSGFEPKYDCQPGETAGLSAGTYYVRVKETATHEAGASAAVTVPPYNAPAAYTVTVNGSYAPENGSGSYAPGAVVTVSAGSRAGYAFTGWTASGVTLSNAGSPTAAFSMPANDVTLTAAWRQNSSSGSGSSGGGSSGGGSGSRTETAKKNDPLPVSTGSQGISVTPTASVRDGTATVNISATLGEEIVKQAVESQSRQIVVSPVISASTSKTEVILPASVLKDLSHKTEAGLTLSTSAASVDLPHSSLSELGGGTGPIAIATEKTGSSVTLTVTAGGQAPDRLPGGVTLTIPWDSCTPGTVAVLVGADGSRRVVRRSVADGPAVTVPLEGPATVELVDNAKSFSDVPAESWAAEAVAFVSSHELFIGTAENIFDPNAPMTRGMLTVALHNLENNPASAFNGSFTDVSSGEWYENAVCWAAERGVVLGHADGSFRPHDSITREQFAVVLWRYAGSPASSYDLSRFADADEAAAYALEALRWANENGLIIGRDQTTLDPAGAVTRAEVAAVFLRYCRAFLSPPAA